MAKRRKRRPKKRPPQKDWYEEDWAIPVLGIFAFGMYKVLMDMKAEGDAKRAKLAASGGTR